MFNFKLYLDIINSCHVWGCENARKQVLLAVEVAGCYSLLQTNALVEHVQVKLSDATRAVSGLTAVFVIT